MAFYKQTKQRNSMLKENYEKQLKEHNTNKQQTPAKPQNKTTSPIVNARENKLKTDTLHKQLIQRPISYWKKWPSKMRKHLTDAKLSKNDVHFEPSLTNDNGEGETVHTENDLSEMD